MCAFFLLILTCETSETCVTLIKENEIKTNENTSTFSDAISGKKSDFVKNFKVKIDLCDNHKNIQMLQSEWRINHFEAVNQTINNK